MSIIDTILNAKDFTTLPPVAAQLLTILEQEDIRIDEIDKIIQADPALTLKLLRISNSPLYGSRLQITSTEQAIKMFGISKLTNIILGISIFSKFWLANEIETVELMNKFRYHSLSTGIMAKSIASKLNLNFKENEFLGGLLHQIGTLALIQYDYKRYNHVINLVKNEGKTNIEAEDEIFGINHIIIGEKIANIWKLPDELIFILTHYIHPEINVYGFNKDLAAVVGLADILCEINGADFYHGLNEYDLTQYEAWKILSENHDVINQFGTEFFTADISAQLIKSIEFLSAIK